jgi:hypothetical protein
LVCGFVHLLLGNLASSADLMRTFDLKSERNFVTRIKGREERLKRSLELQMFY